MAKVKVRVLYPTAFAAMGVDVEGKDEVSVEEDQAEQLLGSGYAEPLKAAPVAPAKKTAARKAT